MDQRRDTIVIGSSAGGVRALRRLLAALPDDLAATVLVVQHQASGAGQLADVLRGPSTLSVDYATDGEPLRRSHVHLAPPDRHLLVANDRAFVTAGPRENRARPAIDPLFRTVAASRGSRTIALQLTGMLADGVGRRACCWTRRARASSARCGSRCVRCPSTRRR